MHSDYFPKNHNDYGSIYWQNSYSYNWKIISFVSDWAIDMTQEIIWKRSVYTDAIELIQSLWISLIFAFSDTKSLIPLWQNCIHLIVRSLALVCLCLFFKIHLNNIEQMAIDNHCYFNIEHNKNWKNSFFYTILCRTEKKKYNSKPL